MNSQRHWITLSTVLVLVATLACLGWVRAGRASAQVGDEVRAHKFVVVDSRGRERAELGMAADDEVRLVVRDAKKRLSVWIGIDAAGAASLAIYGVNENRAIAEISSIDGESAAMILRDACGVRRIGLIAGKDGRSGVSLSDASGRNRCSIGVRDDGESSLALYDKGGTVRAALQVDPVGSVALDLSDAASKGRLTAQVGSKDAQIVIFDRHGKPIWTAVQP